MAKLKARMKMLQQREKAIRDAAIISAAMAGEGAPPKRIRSSSNPRQAVPTITTGDAVEATDTFIEMWAEGVGRIEQKFGPGFFGLHLERTLATEFRFRPDFPGAGARAYSVLLFLTLTEKKPDPLFAWMRDLMFAAGLSEGRICAQAGGRGSEWDKRLRHTKAGKDALAERAFRERLAEQEEADAKRSPWKFEVTDIARKLSFARPGWLREFRNGDFDK